MTAIELAIETWQAVGDGRPFRFLPEDYQFKLLDIAKEVQAGKESGIVGLEEFEERAREIFANPPKPITNPNIDAAKFIAQAAGMLNVPGVVQSILRHSTFAESVYKTAAKNLHPDKGGNEEDFKKLEASMSSIRKPEEKKVNGSK